MADIEVSDRWRGMLATSTRSPIALLVAGVAALAIGLLVAATKGAPAQVAPPATSDRPGDGLAEVSVHVAGAVRAPGLYRLPSGARVADAIAAAGGPSRRGDLDSLNLAQPLADGMKIEVLRLGTVDPIAASPAGAGATPGPMSVNSADRAMLESIPGIGPVRAAAILAYRSEHGAFTSLEQLLEVTGIGPATYEGLLPYVTL